ncbi:MAG: rhomboid family intramembrane serine protease [Spirochaetales bacterium]|nr:rhomboid family intramembrane serine protease [Spirochaetales bacterium]
MEFIRRPVRYTFYNVTFILIGINVGIFLLNQLFPSSFFVLGLFSQAGVMARGYFWQVFTYMFVHSPANLFHLIFNMFGLLIFGSALERRLGSNEFLALYLVTGTATGIVAFLFGLNVVGASGALYALLLGYATLFPDATILMSFIIPVKAPIAVLIFTALSVFFYFTDRTSGISHLAHLAGIVFGYLYFWIRLKMNPIRIFMDRYR